MSRSGKPEMLVEIKYSTPPQLSKGFHIASANLDTKRHFVIYPVEMGFPLSGKVQVLSYREVDKLFVDSR